MKTALRHWRVGAFALLLTGLYACLVPDAGYAGGVYVNTGYDYDGWGPGYRVGPPRGGNEHRRQMQPAAPAFRPAPRSRPAPSIPTRPHIR
jgi:hypothetical protein